MKVKLNVPLIKVTNEGDVSGDDKDGTRDHKTVGEYYRVKHKANSVAFYQKLIVLHEMAFSQILIHYN